MLSLFGWGSGKKRTEVGKWLDSHGYTQEDLVHKSKVSRNTVSKLCSDTDYLPSRTTMQKVLNVIREIDSHKKADDFWKLPPL